MSGLAPSHEAPTQGLTIRIRGVRAASQPLLAQYHRRRDVLAKARVRDGKRRSFG